MAVGLVLSLSVLSAPPLFAAGGDNDSPYNMPDRNGNGGSTSESNGGDGRCAGDLWVHQAPGAGFREAPLSDLAGRARIDNINRVTRLGPGTGVTASPVRNTRLYVPAGEEVRLERDGLSGSLQGDEFTLQGGQPILMVPSPQVGQKRAFLLIGEPGSGGSALASVDYITGLPLENGSINLSRLAGRLASKSELSGKAALIVLVNAANGSPGQPVQITVEALSSFHVEEAPAIRIRIPNL